MKLPIERSSGGIDSEDLQSHFQLAQWCLRNHLPNQAADRLLHISRIEPTHPAVQVLEARLRQLTQQSAESRVVPASHRTPVTTPKPRPASETEPLFVKQFPVETMTQFTRYVQPLLLNRCGQTTCHGSATSSSFQLLRGPHGVQTQVLTWQNLKSSLMQVDDQEPEASPLLRMAHSVHGAADRPPFEPYEQKQFELLHDWVQAVISGKAATAPAEAPPEPWRDSPPAEAAQPIRASTPDRRDPFDPSDFNSRFALPADSVEP